MKVIKFIVIFFLLTLNINNSKVYCQEVKNDSITNQEDNLLYVIDKKANDSINIDINKKKILLYGKAEINYNGIKIESGFIEIDWNNNIITAKPSIDSSGLFVNRPIFTENTSSFTADEIQYNLKTKKGIIKKISTKEGEGYILGKTVKKTEDDIFYFHKGDYTTCNHEKPHFSIRSNKIKVIPSKKIITGPAHLRLFNFPTPLVLPFGYFPNNDKKSSGLIIPSYGESKNLGFFLKEGGYYFALSEKIDLSLKGDIYTKGSWGIKSFLRYKSRYKYNGNLNLSFGNIVNSEKGLPNYSVKKDFFIRWNHQQDPKLSPSILFSANVNAGSSTFHRNNTYNSNDYLTNTFQSSVSIIKKWNNSPFSLSTNLRHSQNTQTKIINLSLPDISLSMNRVFPFKSLNNSTKNKWFDKIGMSYLLNVKNDISIADSLLFKSEALNNFRNGIKHTIPVSTSVKFLKYFVVSPRLSFTERWYVNQINKSWDNQNEIVQSDTINKFTRNSEYNFSTTLKTNIYGLVQFKKSRITAIRHVMTPNISFSYRPDFADEKFGYYKDVQSSAVGDRQSYSITQNGIFGSPAIGRNGNLNFNISNIFEMKVKSKNDSIVKNKKIKLFENINFSSAYNLFADSLKMNDILISGRTRVLDIIDFNFSSRYDPYTTNLNKDNNINTFEFKENNRIARFTNAEASIGLYLTNKNFSKKEKDNSKSKSLWNLNANYRISYFKGYKSSQFSDTIQSLNFSGNFNIVNNWKIGFQSGYDFDTKELTYTSINFYKDLHCWELLFNLIPIGYRKSYTLTIRVKASALQDLKLERKRDWIDTDFN